MNLVMETKKTKIVIPRDIETVTSYARSSGKYDRHILNELVIPELPVLIRHDQEIVSHGEEQEDVISASDFNMPFLYPGEPDVVNLPSITEVLGEVIFPS
eukprot:TRINITY_DN5196_c0_g1_i2.p1 TRINITY_DN5196_c0_g1~~TRINITY_DN5196_c0_g1_i2.p1  ORF type:complete len:100 (-),score=24.72 TRINITY_DN5196_c0_g1_i2:76-375(-)